MDGIRSEHIRGPAHVRCFGDKGGEARLRRFGHCTEEREREDQWRREVAARRSRGRAKRRCMDVVEGEEDAEDSGDD